MIRTIGTKFQSFDEKKNCMTHPFRIDAFTAEESASEIDGRHRRAEMLQ